MPVPTGSMLSMEQQQLVFAGTGTAYHRGLRAAMRLGGALGASSPTGPILSGGAAPSAPVDKSAKAGLVAPWGPGNDWPQ